MFGNYLTKCIRSVGSNCTKYSLLGQIDTFMWSDLSHEGWGYKKFEEEVDTAVPL